MTALERLRASNSARSAFPSIPTNITAPSSLQGDTNATQFAKFIDLHIYSNALIGG
jgi:hypothetical protein